MTVYVDLYLGLTLLLDGLLLAAAGGLDGGAHLPRCALGGLVGAVYAGLTLVLPWLEHPVCLALAGASMALTAYGGSGRVLRRGALFALLSCAFGGCLVLLDWGPGVSLASLLTAAALGYGGLSVLLRGEAPRGAGELAEVVLTHRGRTVRLLALRDSGNALTDPLTGRSVLVVEGEALRPLLPEVFAAGGRLSDPVGLLSALDGSLGGRRLTLLPYRAVGVEGGLLLAVRLDRGTVDGRGRRQVLTALSPTPVSDGGSYRALVGRDG